tara:strand:- start:669 stop:926 length:258 start_codon:yes stop_codon:yes gene_type:complete
MGSCDCDRCSDREDVREKAFQRAYEDVDMLIRGWRLAGLPYSSAISGALTCLLDETEEAPRELFMGIIGKSFIRSASDEDDDDDS